MVITIHSSAIRGYVREVTRPNGELDTSFDPPDTKGTSDVLDEYVEVLEDLVKAVGRYSALVRQDSTMVESLVAEMEEADARMSRVMTSISSGSGSNRAV